MGLFDKNIATYAVRKSDFSETASWRTELSARTVKKALTVFQRTPELDGGGHQAPACLP